jgi:hypothetical protein
MERGRPSRLDHDTMNNDRGIPLYIPNILTYYRIWTWYHRCYICPFVAGWFGSVLGYVGFGFSSCLRPRNISTLNIEDEAVIGIVY